MGENHRAELRAREMRLSHVSAAAPSGHWCSSRSLLSPQVTVPQVTVVPHVTAVLPDHCCPPITAVPRSLFPKSLLSPSHCTLMSLLSPQVTAITSGHCCPQVTPPQQDSELQVGMNIFWLGQNLPKD